MTMEKKTSFKKRVTYERVYTQPSIVQHFISIFLFIDVIKY